MLLGTQSHWLTRARPLEWYLVSVCRAKFVPPCRSITGKLVPKGDAWLHELKLDGYRFQIVKGRSRARLYSRCGHEWTGRLPDFTAAFERLPCRAAVLDGELVLPNTDRDGDYCTGGPRMGASLFRLRYAARRWPGSSTKTPGRAQTAIGPFDRPRTRFRASTWSKFSTMVQSYLRQLSDTN